MVLFLLYENAVTAREKSSNFSCFNPSLFVFCVCVRACTYRFTHHKILFTRNSCTYGDLTRIYEGARVCVWMYVCSACINLGQQDCLGPYRKSYDGNVRITCIFREVASVLKI